MGFSFFSLSFSIVSLSSLRSSLVPTRIMGVLGQWCLTSGYHWKTKQQSEDLLNTDDGVRRTRRLKLGVDVC